MNEEKRICPFRATDCSDRCGFFDSHRTQCSVVSIANSLNDIAMSTDGMECHIEDIPGRLGNICVCLDKIHDAV